MDSEQKISLDLEVISKDEVVEFEGILFSNIAYILLLVNGQNLFDLEPFKDSFIIFKELRKSAFSTGNYLVFTSVSGIADDAGWDLIKVVHENDFVKWIVERDSDVLFFTFNKAEYRNQVLRLEKKIRRLNKTIVLEPSNIIFPE